MFPVSTYKILMAKALDENVEECWIDWALEMVEAGFESMNLYMLAGTLKPYNQFELRDLTSKVLLDLNLDYSDKELTRKNYIYYLLSESVDQPATYPKTLELLKDIYDSTNQDPGVQDFALLYWAKEDLDYDVHQYYWPDADRTNIDETIRAYFQNWISAYLKS